VFTLRVHYESVKWTIDKRFSDCFKLSEDLNRKYEGVPEFPGRHPKFLHDAYFLQMRQKELEMYFQSFEQGAFATDEMKNFFNAFTELHKLGYEINPDTSKLLPFPNSENLYCAVVQVPTSSGFLLPHRTTVIRLASENLIVYAPVQIDDALNYELIRKGKVSSIIVPNKLHFTFLADWLVRFPDAKIYVPPGIKEKIDVMEKAVVLKAQTEEAWKDEVEQILTTGNSFFSEVLLFHKKAKVLIVADFLINLPASIFSPENQVSPDASVYSILTTQLFPPTLEDDRPKCSTEHAKYCTDAKLFSALTERLLALDFHYIIMVYGNIIGLSMTENPGSAKDVLRNACQLILSEVSERWAVTNTLFFISWFKRLR